MQNENMNKPQNPQSCQTDVSGSTTRVLKTTVVEIANYWIENNNISELELNFDWGDAHTHCWNCGDDKYSKSTKKTRLERCHIIPNALGGHDKPYNYVLLCKSCHAEAPNINNNFNMWDWIKSNYIPMSFYGTYKINKALVMFKEKNGYSFFEKVKTIENFNCEFNKRKKSISSHGVFINISTYYYLLKSIADNCH